MKWAPLDGSTQHGIGAGGRRYAVVQANSVDYVAYELQGTVAQDLGTRRSEADARQLCQDREDLHLSLQRRA